MKMRVKTFSQSQSSISLDKFLQSQRNLPKRPPQLFSNDSNSQVTATVTDPPLPPAPLDLNHHVLQKLEHSCNNIKQFNQIHAQLIVLDIFQHSLAASRYIKKLCNSLNSISHCLHLYDHIEEPDAFICNTIIKSFSTVNKPHAALRFYYDQMIAMWVLPNHYTFPLILKVCADLKSSNEGQKAHACIVKLGFEFDTFVRNSLMHMYSVFGRVSDARMVFDNGYVLDLVSWNSMIDGYVKNGDVGLARELFDEMLERDAISWNSMISGYAGIGDMGTAKELFVKMPDKDNVSWNIMIDGYAKIRNVSMARWVFDQMPLRNVISWNIMLALYLKCKDYGECLKLFDWMIEERQAKPNEASLVSVLTACANFRKLKLGKSIHFYIITDYEVEQDELLSTALLTMYAKCGEPDLARHIFDEMSKRSVVSWNSIIMGYAANKLGEKALEMFLEMEKSSIMPNEATFVGVLCACSNVGMLLEGWWYFDLMQRKYKIEPKTEHYGCMFDLLRQAGLMNQLEDLVRKMNLGIESKLFEAFKHACRTSSYSELGEIVAKQLIKLNPKDIAPYVLLGNIYSGKAKWDEVGNVREIMKENGLDSAAITLAEFGSIFNLEEGSLHRRSMVHLMLSEISCQMKLSSAYYCNSVRELGAE
ncbi:pentatricopeptide repeat-containing protein At4g18840-like [Euphorbia lathyris]|uniref:pentatricopeptide repeat-containing protein At4g18840-like n=1 Tax=Euphorbia lathyris TaxID=212925 RepID=UPI0033135A04